MRPAGRVRDDDLEELRRRVSLVDVASEYMQLKRAGRLYKALCPFHQEKTPSFSLDPTKGLYFCHGCHEGGDAIRLVEKLENLSFVEAVERLARRFGMQLRYEQLSPADRQAFKRRVRLVEAHRAAVEFYHRLLMGPEGAEARTYLKGRGFSKATVEEFRLGYSPQARENLARALLRGGFSENELVEAGLASRQEGGGVVDRFRARLMFPIFDVTGEPVAFGARRMTEGDGPKYLNSAESPIYKKGQVLYGLHLAKGEIVKRSRALVVEGYTDVIALHQEGLKEAVATCGTALGLDHLKTLQRFTQNLALALDADDAGGAAAERTYEQLVGEAQKMGLQLRVVLLPRGQDPADCVVKRGGEEFGRLVEGAVPLLEFVLEREAARYNVGDPEVRARALNAGLRLLAKTDNEVVRMEYARRLSGWIGVDPNVIFVELEKVMRTGTTTRATGNALLKRSSAQVRLEREALKLVLQHPHIAAPFCADVDEGHFSVPAHRRLWESHRARSGVEDDEVGNVAAELSVEPLAGDPTDRVAADIFRKLKEAVLVRRIDEMKGRLQRLNPENEPAEYRVRFAELIELEAARRSLVETEERGR